MIWACNSFSVLCHMRILSLVLFYVIQSYWFNKRESNAHRPWVLSLKKKTHLYKSKDAKQRDFQTHLMLVFWNKTSFSTSPKRKRERELTVGFLLWEGFLLSPHFSTFAAIQYQNPAFMVGRNWEKHGQYYYQALL